MAISLPETFAPAIDTLTPRQIVVELDKYVIGQKEAKRAVVELHDKPFMGRKLVVSGAKTTEREPNYRG